jgi:hypothetical protein
MVSAEAGTMSRAKKEERDVAFSDNVFFLSEYSKRAVRIHGRPEQRT